MYLNQLSTLGIGALSAFVLIVVVKLLLTGKERHIAALGLVLVAVIYPIAVLFGSVDFGQWLVEAMIAIVIGSMAYIGFYGNNDKVLAMGWISHGAWDFVIPHATGVLPHWWALWCAGLDIAVGLYLWLDRSKFDPSVERTAMKLRNARNGQN